MQRVAWATGSATVSLVGWAHTGTGNRRENSVTGVTTRFFLSLGDLFFSLILGAVALGFFWFHFPDWTLQLFKWSGTIRQNLISGTWPGRYEVILRALVDERQIVYMGFVLATHVARVALLDYVVSVLLDALIGALQGLRVAIGEFQAGMPPLLRGITGKIFVSTVSGLIIFFVLRAIGIETDFKLIVISFGLFAVFLGISVLA